MTMFKGSSSNQWQRKQVGYVIAEKKRSLDRIHDRIARLVSGPYLIIVRSRELRNGAVFSRESSMTLFPQWRLREKTQLCFSWLCYIIRGRLHQRRNMKGSLFIACTKPELHLGGTGMLVQYRGLQRFLVKLSRIKAKLINSGNISPVVETKRSWALCACLNSRMQEFMSCRNPTLTKPSRPITFTMHVPPVRKALISAVQGVEPLIAGPFGEAWTEPEVALMAFASFHLFFTS